MGAGGSGGPAPRRTGVPRDVLAPDGRAAALLPMVFEQCDEGVHNRITGETWNPDADPLKAAALLDQMFA